MSNNSRMGPVSLSVADLLRSISFYQNTIGLDTLDRSDNRVSLGVDSRPLLHLHELPGARPHPRAAGLYHFALLLPSRPALGETLRHLLANNAPITGYADHAVSEAVYLSDPDGHGIEIYRDRARDAWQYPGGALRMTVDPLDVVGVLATAGDGAWRGLPDETVMGHVHLQVADIGTTETFYTDLLGFDLMVRYGSAATFLATDGYHHHIGANTWQGTGLLPAPENAARLLEYTIVLDSAAQLATVADRLAAASYAPTAVADGLIVADPSGLTLRLTAR